MAAIDETFELLPNNSWKLLDAMMVRGGEVETSTAQMQVIASGTSAARAIAPGGGGGRAVGELFGHAALWKARVPLTTTATRRSRSRSTIR